jgi:Tol biopolymer transport system component
MKRMKTATTVIVSALLAGAWISGADRKESSAEVELQAAIHTEMVDGNFKAAIEKYRKVAQTTNRAVAAQALVRMAECYQKMGDVEGRRIYEQVLREYGDQKEAATLARTRLAKLQAPAGPVLRSLWRGPDFRKASMSADGRHFVYTSITGREIFLGDIATGRDRKVVEIPKGYRFFPENPRISPDGKLVAYSLTDEKYKTDIRLLALNGDSSPRILYGPAEPVSIYDWSADGKALAIVVWQTIHLARIGVLSLADGSVRMLKSDDLSGIFSLRFSPDGKYLTYDQKQPGSDRDLDIFMISINDGRETRVVTDRARNVPIGWSPDGRWFLYTSDRAGTVDLWGAPFADGQFNGTPQLLRTDFPSSAAVGWSAAGGLYFWTKHGGPVDKLELATIDLAKDSLSSVRISESLEQGRVPVWSPDGSQLAYLISAPGTRAVIGIRRIANGDIRQLKPKGLRIDYLPRWARDAQSILVIGADDKKGDGLFRVDPGSGKATMLLAYDRSNRKRIFTPDMAWLPDGRVLLIRADGPEGGVFRLDTETGDLKTIFTHEPGQISGDLNVSPDGRRIYFNRRFQTVSQTAIIERNLISGAEKELVRGPLMYPPHLSPDGRYIASGSADPKTNTRFIMVIPTDGGQIRELMRIPSQVKPDEVANLALGDWVFAPAWADDSKAIIIRKRPADKTLDSELWFAPVSGSSPIKLNGSVSEKITSLVPSPDGVYLAYTLPATVVPATMELSVLENFLPSTRTAKN